MSLLFCLSWPVSLNDCERLTYIQLPMAEDEDTLPADMSTANRKSGSDDVIHPDAPIGLWHFCVMSQQFVVTESKQQICSTECRFFFFNPNKFQAGSRRRANSRKVDLLHFEVNWWWQSHNDALALARSTNTNQNQKFETIRHFDFKHWIQRYQWELVR